MATQTDTQIFNNWWSKYFTRVNDKSVKCDMCNKICTKQYVPIHLYISHNITDQEVILRWNNDNHSIWQHFFKKDLFTAECKYCGVIIKSAYYKHTLSVHLESFHIQEIAEIREEITRTWASPHFTFTYSCKTKCNYCNYSVKTYYGVGVLTNHLKKRHNLDEHFVHRIGKELDYLEKTMQCTTDESNVATSFQYTH